MQYTANVIYMSGPAEKTVKSKSPNVRCKYWTELVTAFVKVDTKKGD